VLLIAHTSQTAFSAPIATSQVDDRQGWITIMAMQHVEHIEMAPPSVAHAGGGNFHVDGQAFVVHAPMQDARGLHHAVLNVYGQRAASFDYIDGHWYVAFNLSLPSHIAGAALAPDAAAALFDMWRAYGFPLERQ
jgi:hypothetical protein